MEHGIIAGRYHLLELVGEGSFGQVYRANDPLFHCDIAVKVEYDHDNIPSSQLENESNIYRELKYSSGFPIVYGFGRADGMSYLAMDLLGPSLATLFHICGRRFSLKTTCNVGLQVVDRLEALHAKGYVHRDVKPENLVIGDEQNMDTIYLVDLGLLTSYRDPYSGEHISEFHDDDDYLMGTPLYYSVNRHYGIPHTRRDDLISLLYLMLYLKRGSLPWQGRTSQVMASMKVKAKIIQLCKGFPASFSVFAEYVTHLQFDSRPNYAHIRKLLR
ncbi:hypothetical protein FOMPIDRAFT_1080910, partial [Fomitopsis schrenkii]